VKYLHTLLGFYNPALIADTRFHNLFLTVGVSYYTLQAVSYLTDIYLETSEPEPHLGFFALYLGFFPKMLQGPIERADELLPQLKRPFQSNYDNLRSGLLLFAWGLFKKVAVANRLAIYVNAIYGNVHNYKGLTLVIATYMYAIQILADFSGYTDMALGVAQMFNIRLTENFNSPYLATSVIDFWRRWHISFSRWILDYIFKPLQLAWRSAGIFGTATALLITFLFSGLWHGAEWTFIVWGLLHGVFIASSVLSKPYVDRLVERTGLHNHPLRRFIRIAITFNLVCFAWIFFRANSIADGWYVVTHLFTGVPDYVTTLLHVSGPQLAYLLGPLFMDKGFTSFALLMVAVSIMFTGSFLKRRINLLEYAAPIRWAAYYFLLLAIVYLAVYNDVGFVYLQF
jgi:D-alanyl-lipoteichoic acid acyltransferase DltB (MBOAT superfamily)